MLLDYSVSEILKDEFKKKELKRLYEDRFGQFGCGDCDSSYINAYNSLKNTKMAQLTKYKMKKRKQYSGAISYPRIHLVGDQPKGITSKVYTIHNITDDVVRIFEKEKPAIFQKYFEKVEQEKEPEAVKPKKSNKKEGKQEPKS